MPRIFLISALALATLVACAKDEPKDPPIGQPDPGGLTEPVPETPPAPVVDDAPALPAPVEECKGLDALKKAQYAVEDEMQFVRASVVAKTRADLPPAPSLPREPPAAAGCDAKIDHTKAVTGLLRTHRDSLRAQLNGTPAPDEKTPKGKDKAVDD